MLCPKCNTKMVENCDYCPKCGYKHEELKKEPEESKQPSEEQSVSLAMFFLLVLCLVVAFLTGSFPQPL